MAKRKKAVEEGPTGAPKWIVTFSDMVSLLVTFFVMLMSFSTITERESMLIVEAFSNSRGGVIENPAGPDAVEPPPIDRMSGVHTMTGAKRPHARPDEELQNSLAEMGQRDDDEHLALDLTQAHDGLRIAFDRRAAFAPGSTRLTPDLERSLSEIGRVLEGYGHLVVVEGHTDAAFKPTPRFPSAEALGAARASAGARALLAGSALPPESVQIASLGAARPRSSNDNAVDRTDNRRVELLVVSLSKARALRVERDRESQRLEQLLREER